MKRKKSQWGQRVALLIYGHPPKRVPLKIQGHHPQGPPPDLFTHPYYDPLFRIQRALEREKRLQTF